MDKVLFEHVGRLYVALAQTQENVNVLQNEIKKRDDQLSLIRAAQDGPQTEGKSTQ